MLTPARLLRHILFRLVPVLALALGAAPAHAQGGDPPSRVGRLNHVEGNITFSTVGDDEWTDAEPNRPLTKGDRLLTEPKSRAEVQVGSSAVRLDGQTKIEIILIDDHATQLSVLQGSVYVRVRSLPEGENFEIDTPNLAYRAAYPGDYRIDVDPVRGTTRITIHSGTGAVYGEAGQSLALGGGQQVTFKLRGLAQMGTQESPPQDNFDRWALERNRRDDQSVSARFIPREVVGYQALDSSGTWSQDAVLGPVWFPQGVGANWAPYRQGRWEWVSQWGWTWMDEAAWGFAPFHYGRWTTIGSKWAWVPGRIGLKPVYAPALVAFLGGSTGGVNWSTTLGGGRPGIAWFPLAPGEAWQPPYKASPIYLSNLNRNLAAVTSGYAHQKRSDALTAVSAEDFNKGKVGKTSWVRVAGNVLGNAQVIAPPAMPERMRQLAMAQASALPRAVTPSSAPAASTPSVDLRKVAGQQQQQQQMLLLQQAAQAQRAAEQAKAEQARALEVAKADQLRAAEQARVDKVRGVEQARIDKERATEQARAAREAYDGQRQAQMLQRRQAQEQARAAAIEKFNAAAAKTAAARAATAKLAEAAKRESIRHDSAKLEAKHASARNEVPKRNLAKREQVRSDVVAKREHEKLAKREAIGRRAEQAKREALARQESEVRRVAHVESARRAAEKDAQTLRDQRTKREEQQRRQEQAAREQAQRDALSVEQLQRERERTRARPEWRRDPGVQPEIWQRGSPLVYPGRTS